MTAQDLPQTEEGRGEALQPLVWHAAAGIRGGFVPVCCERH